MRHYQRLNNIIGWAVGLLACAVYIMTAERTTSWWDCGEYISTAFKLQVGHPPGAPTFQLIGAIFSNLAGSNVVMIGWLVNIVSALCSGFTILFLFWSITMIAKKMVLKNGEMTSPKMVAIFGSAIVGSLAYCFSDSFWFSAVEGEVYAMSSFFTALTFWAILKWETVADQPHHLRWLVFIFFMIGLAIGVHLLNLLVIPAVVFVIYYKKFKRTKKGMWYSFGLSLLLLGSILWLIVPWTVKLAGYFELLFVNSFGTPFNTGTIIFFVLLIGGLVWSIRYAIKHHKVVLHTGLLCLVFLLIGYSTFFILVIRANAGVPINENEPKNALTLLSYLNRDQYGSRPLVHGEWFGASTIIDSKPGAPLYERNDESGKYIEVGKGMPTYKYRPEDEMLFPRMGAHDQQGRNYATYYKIWSGTKGDKRPSMGENIRFFLRYQVGWEYVRYFMWNFVGRQNNEQGFGYDAQGNRDVLRGNWISGINFIDEARLGPQSNLPEDMGNNQARNKYYFLPLLLGLIGLIYHYQKDRQGSFVVFLLFFMTGLAIILYLNQPSWEPRERDYSVVGSFYAFAIWIGMGVMAIIDWLSKKTPAMITSFAVSALCLVAVPCLMAKENWDDHDRSTKYMARDYARNTLESCKPNGILITNGDNDTFPVWYCQEVEGVRTDVRVINSALANSYWHVQPLFNKVYNSDPLPFNLKKEQYGQGHDHVLLDTKDYGEHKDLDQVMRLVSKGLPATQMRLNDGTLIDVIPTPKVKVAANAEQLVKDGIITPNQAPHVVPSIEWTIQPDGQGALGRSSVAFLDILGANDWKRPIHVASAYAQQSIWPISNYAQLSGSIYQFVPCVNENKVLDSRLNGIETDRTYDLFMNKFTWGNMQDPRTYVDPESLGNATMGRYMYGLLSQALIYEHKNDSAVKVLDKALTFFPHHKIPFEGEMIIFIADYLNAGATEKGKALATQMIDISEQRLLYFESFPSKFRRSVEVERRRCLEILYTIRVAALEGKNLPELEQRIDKILEGRI